MKYSLLIAFMFVGFFVFSQTNVAMDELKQTDNGLVFSEPVRSNLQISLPYEGDFNVSVFNSFGEKQLYKESVSESVLLEVLALKPGSYYVILKSKKISKAFKFLKV